MDKYYNLEPPKLRLYKLTTKLADKIAPHISSALIDLGMIFDKFIFLEVPYWRVQNVQVLQTHDMLQKMNRKIHIIM